MNTQQASAPQVDTGTGSPRATLPAISSGLAQERGGTSGELLRQTYNELRRLAAWHLANEQPGQTLQPTALVHEAWLRLGGPAGVRWNSRRHFFSAAGEAMRRILVENARRKKRLKRGGQWQRIDIQQLELPDAVPDEHLLALDEALDRLAGFKPRAAELVKLCFFLGLSQQQAAKELGISLATAERTWAYARAWLFREIRSPQNRGD